MVKARIAILAAALLATFALAACSAPAGQSSSAEPSSEAPAPATSSSAAADEGAYTIDLDYNAGTGYEWTYEADVDGIVELVSQDTSAEYEGDLDGGPLQDHFTFRGIKPGEVVLTFNLARSWEADEPPAETQVYAFTVNDDLEMILNPYKSNFA